MSQDDNSRAPEPLPTEPDPVPMPEAPPVPWHDPGPPVRKVNLPPNEPTPGIPMDPPPDRSYGSHPSSDAHAWRTRTTSVLFVPQAAEHNVRFRRAR